MTQQTPTGTPKMSGIDEYLAQLPDDQREALQRLREIIMSVVPDARETIAWKMPAFRYGGSPLVGFAAFKNHLSFFPMSSAVVRSYESELTGFVTTKGTIHFTPDRPIPAPLVRKIVRARIKEASQGKAVGSGPGRAPARRPRHPMPDHVKEELEGRGLMDAYLRRPPYQQNDYIGWITQARQEATRTRRLEQMLHELEQGDVYMKMPYRPRRVRG